MLRSRWLPGLLLAVAAALPGCGDGTSVDRDALRQAEAQRQAQTRADAAAAREAERLAALWTYHDIPVEKGRQLSATIASREDLETDGRTPRRVRLVFRDHPSWGRSAYLLLEAGDFACGARCTVGVSVDAGEPARMAARRPPTDEAIALFINDAEALWRLTAGATALAIEFSVKAGGTRTARFDVAGLDRSKLPGWN